MHFLVDSQVLFAAGLRASHSVLGQRVVVDSRSGKRPTGLHLGVISSAQNWACLLQGVWVRRRSNIMSPVDSPRFSFQCRFFCSHRLHHTCSGIQLFEHRESDEHFFIPNIVLVASRRCMIDYSRGQPQHRRSMTVRIFILSSNSELILI